MPRPLPRSLTRALLVAGLPFVLLAACSDDDDTATTTSATTSSSSSASDTSESSSSGSGAPEDKISSDAEVAEGLEKMVTQAKGSGYQEAHETWEDVEGTVKQKEPDIYARIEEDLTLLKNSEGDAAKAQAAADSLSKSVDEYLAKHPG